MFRKTLLLCGILSSLLYAAMTVFHRQRRVECDVYSRDWMHAHAQRAGAGDGHSRTGIRSPERDHRRGGWRVIMDTSLKCVAELFHLARRMRRIALQSAVGAMALSIIGMFIAFGGAIFQEVIDLTAVLNALCAAVPAGELSDY